MWKTYPTESGGRGARGSARWSTRFLPAFRWLPPMTRPRGGWPGRMGGCSARLAEEIAAAAALVARVLRHPVLAGAARAAAQGRCYRETPVTLRLESGAIVEGNVDLAYVEGEEVVVVDFKTDRELEGAVETYRRQVQVYAAAIGAALQRPARAVLMRV